MISVDFKINLINHTKLILRIKKAFFEKIDCKQYPMLREGLAINNSVTTLQPCNLHDICRLPARSCQSAGTLSMEFR